MLNKCVDDQGEAVKIGDQKDIIEYAINFFERIEEVLPVIHEREKHDDGEGRLGQGKDDPREDAKVG